MDPRDAWTFRRLVTGHPLGDDRGRLSAEFLPLALILAELSPEARPGAWQAVLARHPDAERIIDLMAEQDPAAPPPDDVGDPADDWGPIRIPTLPPPVPFPCHVLPLAVAGLVAAGAEAVGCAPDFFAATALVVASGAIGRTVRLRLKDGYFAGASLFAVNVAIPSDGKTPAQMIVGEAIERIDKLLRAEYEAALKARGDEMAALAPEPGSKRPKAPPPPEPQLRRVDVDDFTMEALTSVLAENGRGLVTIQDELTSFLLGLNQYKGGKGNDRSVVMKIWSGESLKKDRVGHENLIPIFVAHPFLSLIGGLPPDMLPEMTHAKGRADGFLDRFLFVYPEPRPIPDWTESGVSPAVMDAWCGLVMRLWERPMAIKDGKLIPHIASLTPEARGAWVGRYNAHCREMNSRTFPPDLRSPWGKFREYAARLALVLACMRDAADPCGDPRATPEVRVEDVQGAWELVDYFKVQARRARATLTHGRSLAAGGVGKVVCDWLKEQRRVSFSGRDVKQARRTLDEADLADALANLHAMNVIQPREAEGRGGKKGRPHSIIYDVNPALFAAQNTQNPQNEGEGGLFEDSEAFEYDQADSSARAAG